MKRAILILGTLALLLFGASASQAGPLGLFNTGVDGSGTPLADGTVGDPHYALTVVPAGTTDIRVRTSAGGFPIGPWVGDDSSSAWIGPNNDNQVQGPAGTYDYRTTFNLASGASLVTITGQWSTDDAGLDILLNGVSTGKTAGGFGTFYAFTVAGPGITGANTLDFLVSNGGGPTGLRVEITDASAVPEPATMTLLGIGLAGLAGYGVRRRKQAESAA